MGIIVRAQEVITGATVASIARTCRLRRRQRRDAPATIWNLLGPATAEKKRVAIGCFVFFLTALQYVTLVE